MDLWNRLIGSFPLPVTREVLKSAHAIAKPIVEDLEIAGSVSDWERRDTINEELMYSGLSDTVSKLFLGVPAPTGLAITMALGDKPSIANLAKLMEKALEEVLGGAPSLPSSMDSMLNKHPAAPDEDEQLEELMKYSPDFLDLLEQYE